MKTLAVTARSFFSMQKSVVEAKYDISSIKNIFLKVYCFDMRMWTFHVKTKFQTNTIIFILSILFWFFVPLVYTKKTKPALLLQARIGVCGTGCSQAWSSIAHAIISFLFCLFHWDFLFHGLHYEDKTRLSTTRRGKSGLWGHTHASDADREKHALNLIKTPYMKCQLCPRCTTD